MCICTINAVFLTFLISWCLLDLNKSVFLNKVFWTNYYFSVAILKCVSLSLKIIAWAEFKCGLWRIISLVGPTERTLNKSNWISFVNELNYHVREWTEWRICRALFVQVSTWVNFEGWLEWLKAHYIIETLLKHL